MKTRTIAAALGAGCFASFAVASGALGGALPESTAWLLWSALVLIGSFACGYRTPERAWRWGAIVVGVQPLLYFLWLLVDGEITSPTSSTGGLVAWFIVSVALSVLSQAAMLSSHVGARVRIWRQSRRGASS